MEQNEILIDMLICMIVLLLRIDCFAAMSHGTRPKQPKRQWGGEGFGDSPSLSTTHSPRATHPTEGLRFPGDIRILHPPPYPHLHGMDKVGGRVEYLRHDEWRGDLDRPHLNYHSHCISLGNGGEWSNGLW